MEPIYWVILFLVLCGLVALIPVKKGRSGWLAFFAMVLPAVPLMIGVSFSMGNDMVHKALAMWTVAFLCPVVGFVWALMTPDKAEMAARSGAYADMRKCPFCAEPVRREAVKCKHCGSELEQVVAATPAPTTPSNLRSRDEPPFGR